MQHLSTFNERSSSGLFIFVIIIGYYNGISKLNIAIASQARTIKA